MTKDNVSRFAKLTYEDFKALAKDPNLSQYEKIGFPDEYRARKEENIFLDIENKLGNLKKKNQLVLDIGPGCSGLAFMIIDFCRKQGHTLVLIDSQEMLNHLPDESFIVKIPAYYPQECLWVFDKYAGSFNVILSYSVLHYVFAEGNLFDFLDRSLSLLADDGEVLLGDIPNISKRKRFFSSRNGIEFHKKYTGSDEEPEVSFNILEPGQIDDAVIAGIIARCQFSGFDAYCLPQPADLPMSNRRDDIFIRKP